MHTKIYFWVNRYFYSPSALQILLAVLLLPFSLIYSLFVTIKKFTTKEINFDDLKIISVGNLVVGGSGKTPLCKAIYSLLSPKFNVFIVLRGYKRQSKGLFVVANNGKILTPVKISGDEAMEYAIFGANVIVSEDRIKGIQKAKSLGAKCVILDDGFGKFKIQKFDILLKPSVEPKLSFTFPSGAYRYPLSFYKFGDFIPQNSDIIKSSSITNQTTKMVLVSAIANPQRLGEHFSKCVGVELFPDHHSFSKDELQNILKKYQATSLLVTMKDYAKIKEFNLPLSIIELHTTLSDNFKEILYNYTKEIYA
ncbi:MAG: tetraacyldisaccharide 4'-kinase [Campylobacter sp.]|nr:tetraacyldisaccharide 4'-kinase [Campylobacter sp.]